MLAVIGIHASKLLHDRDPVLGPHRRRQRGGHLVLAAFRPGAVFLGWIARAHGVDAAGWTLTVTAGLVGTLLVTPRSAAANPFSSR